MSPKSPKIQLGQRIDHDSLEIVEVLGIGGYGVVYRAVETYSLQPRSFAVKCLPNSCDKSPIRRQFHIREIALHQISSSHPGVITLHRIVEDQDGTYIIMDYAPDHDLFTQILSNRRYLGNDALIKHVFMQLVDAVEYCHSLGIYHRDLKPENVLCFDNGSRVAITDFGLATTEKVSGELHTGSIYHMSPECQNGSFSLDGRYSPKSNDIWSLGIILLNLATGRNPWKTATADDVTFQAYLRDPQCFFPSVLPVSFKISDILLQMLHVDWKQRITLPELRQQMEDITTFYAPDVVFDGSQARCAWEVRADTQQNCTKVTTIEGLRSFWSGGSRSDFVPSGCSALLSTPANPPVTPTKVLKVPHLRQNVMYMERRSSFASSDSSTSPPTPGVNDSVFGDDGLVDLGIQVKKSAHRVQYPSDHVGLISEVDILGSQPAHPLSAVGALIDDPWANLDIENTDPIWAAQNDRRLSLSSDSGVAPARSSTPSLEAYAWPPASFLAATADVARSTQEAAVRNPRNQRVHPSINEDPAVQRWPSSNCNMQNMQVKLNVPTELVKEGDGWWKFSRLRSTRNWFSPAKLFSSSVAK